MNTIDITEFEKASSGSIIRLLPWDDRHPFYVDHDLLVEAADALATRAPLHLSGPSGTGKTHFLNSVLFGPTANLAKVCETLDLPRWPKVKCHRIVISTLETPAEIWYRVEVEDFSTKEKPQRILDTLNEAASTPETLHVIWLVESGRGPTESVQGGFLDIVGQSGSKITEPHGRTFDTSNVTFVTDSNHAANESGDFAIWDLDQAYGRRWSCRLSFESLSSEHETIVLRELAPDAPEKELRQVVALAAAIRQKHLDGSLQSILPPTIDTMLHLLGKMRRLPVDAHRLVFNTLLGFCWRQDRDEAEAVYAEAFGVRVKTDTPAGEAVGIL